MKKIKQLGDVLSKAQMQSINGANFCLNWGDWCIPERDEKQCCSGLYCNGGSCGFIDITTEG